MIITHDFVMLNFPKTGSSFVRSILKQIHGYDTPRARLLRGLRLDRDPAMAEVLVPVIDKASSRGLRSQHGTYRQIPQEHRNKTIVSVTRNPFDRYVSDYLFGWWQRHPPAPPEQLAAQFPNFPDLSFAEYHQMNDLFGRRDRLGKISPKIDLGLFTIQFIQFYFRNPAHVLSTIDDEYIDQGRYGSDMPPVVFLHQENLREELYQFLLKAGYSAEKIGFILEAGRVNVTPRASGPNKTDGFFTPDLARRVLDKDRLLFELFPEYKGTGPGSKSLGGESN